MGRLKDARVLSVALLFIMLAAGFLMGMAWKGTQVATAATTDEAPREEGERRRLVIDGVGLEPEKRAEVDEIIQHFRAQMRALDEEFREAYTPRQRALVRHTRDSIKSVLSPAQEAVYDSLLKARYDRRSDENEGDGQGRGGRGSQ